MPDFENKAYQTCKEWVAHRINEKKTWDEIKVLCTKETQFEITLENLKSNPDYMFPLSLNRDSWEKFVEYYKSIYSAVKIVGGVKPVGVESITYTVTLDGITGENIKKDNE